MTVHQITRHALIGRLADPSLLRHQAYIDGQWVNADGGDTVTVTDPATGIEIGTVPNMGAAETRRAIEAAEEARHGWAALAAKDRAVVLRRWFDLIVANLPDLAAIMTAEQGKPLAESQGEIRYAASFAEWFAEEAKRAYGDLIPAPRAQSRIMVLKQPIGVVAAITPWNFPSAMITRKCARPSPPAAPSWSSPPNSRPIRRWRWPSLPNAPASPRASSTSSRVTRQRSAAR